MPFVDRIDGCTDLGIASQEYADSIRPLFINFLQELRPTQYLLRNGPYSDEIFVGQGAFLAAPETVSHLEGVRDGDAIFSHPLNSFVSWLIMYVTGGPWSHVGTLTSEGTVLEVIAQGCVERPATCYLDGKRYILIGRLMAAITDEQRRQMVSFGRSKVGIVKYGWGKAIRLGLRIIFGFSHSWKIRCSIDVVLFLTMLWFLSKPFPLLRLGLIVLAGIYVAIVFATSGSRRKEQEHMDVVNRDLERAGGTSRWKAPIGYS
jgi:hypothetical protein